MLRAGGRASYVGCVPTHRWFVRLQETETARLDGPKVSATRSSVQVVGGTSTNRRVVVLNVDVAAVASGVAHRASASKRSSTVARPSAPSTGVDAAASTPVDGADGLATVELLFDAEALCATPDATAATSTFNTTTRRFVLVPPTTCTEDRVALTFGPSSLAVSVSCNRTNHRCVGTHPTYEARPPALSNYNRLIAALSDAIGATALDGAMVGVGCEGTIGVLDKMYGMKLTVAEKERNCEGHATNATNATAALPTASPTAAPTALAIDWETFAFVLAVE